MTKEKIDNSNEQSSSQRLVQVLNEVSDSGGTLTASVLCERAGLSRTALYRYHPEIVEQLRDLQGQRGSEAIRSKLEVKCLKDENHALALQLTQLAGLVDHYYSAWQDAESLLKRLERELGDLRKTKIVPLR